EKGYIDCVINPHPGERLKYLNSSGSWAKDVLFPYDYVHEAYPHIVAIVEGPRDALITIDNGLMALAVLGAKNWSEKCTNLIRSLGASIIILMLDPDNAGEDARKIIFNDLKPFGTLVPIRLPHKRFL